MRKRPLDDLPRATLYDMARRRGIADAVWLTREQLIDQLREPGQAGSTPQGERSASPATRGPGGDSAGTRGVPADLDRLPRSELFHLARARGVAKAVMLSREELIAVLNPEVAPGEVVSPRSAPPSRLQHELAQLSRQELLARARERGIPGIPVMSREELIRALRGAPPQSEHPDAAPSEDASQPARRAVADDALDGLSRNELFWLARAHNVRGTLRFSRDELIDALRRAGATGLAGEGGPREA